MVIGYKERFVEPVLKGKKKHTLREDLHNRWKPGRTMHMATGVRTNKQKQFYEAVCKSTQAVEIIPAEYMNDTVVKVDGRKLQLEEIQQLAWNDGFDNIIDFLLWFADGFKGKIIHWTELKY